MFRAASRVNLADHFKGKQVAIIHDKTAYGKGIADEAKKAMNAAGLNEAMYEAIAQRDKDFSADQQDEAGRTSPQFILAAIRPRPGRSFGKRPIKD